MLYPRRLRRGDRAAVVSLSNGMLGDAKYAHFQALGAASLKSFGLEPVFMPNALKGSEYLKRHPEARAADLKSAFTDNRIGAVVCAIGGSDTYLTLPYLMEDAAFCRAVREHPKIFTGFSDSTVNHLMFYRLGLTTFYGPNFINDLAEMDGSMLPYTRAAFSVFLEDGADGGKPLVIESSPVWYDERPDFSAAAVGTRRAAHEERRGFEPLGDFHDFSGTLWGGCLESLVRLLDGEKDRQAVCKKYSLLLNRDERRGKIVFLETSEERPAPELLRRELGVLDGAGFFEGISGLIVGKPQNECWYAESRRIFDDFGRSHHLPVLYNVNIGHAYPRAVLPCGAAAEVSEKRITVPAAPFAGSADL